MGGEEGRSVASLETDRDESRLLTWPSLACVVIRPVVLIVFGCSRVTIVQNFYLLLSFPFPGPLASGATISSRKSKSMSAFLAKVL